MDSEYDIIFAGGGACACVTAGRLAAADPNLKILVIEAGKNTKGLQEHVQPARYYSHLSPTSQTLSFYVSKPSEHLGGRTITIPAGHCVGGGSSVNFVMYTRAAASDYDDWEVAHQNPGWGSRDLIPLAEKLETYQIAPGESTHGSSGPIKVSWGGHSTNSGEQFLSTAKVYDPTRGSTDDVNDFYTCNVYGRWPKYIDQETGKRSDTAHHYVYNQENNLDLTILEETRVKRVIFEGDRAVGVEYVKELPAGEMRAENEQVYTARCSKLVVLAAGTFGSPAILERSGIGGSELLQSMDIPCRVELPGVGENYLDHNLIFLPMMGADETDSMDTIFHTPGCEQYEVLDAQWSKDGTGLMAHNGIDGGIKMRPNEVDLQCLGQDFKPRWDSYFASAPDKPIIWIGILTAFLGDYSILPPTQKIFSIGYYTEYPVSTGRTHITSGQNAHAPPDFEPGYLKEAADVAILRWGYKRAREYGRRMPLFRGEFPAGHPSFMETSPAGIRPTNGPCPISEPDIVYTPEDDEVIDEFHRKTVATTWHSLGTCSMRSREKGGVVDSSLNVYGVKGLKVADCSICPANVSANTYNTAIIIGEKAALIIAAELGIKGV